jgi:hypothetical protein
MSVMQGFERMDRQLTDAAALAGHLIPAGSMFAFLAGHRAEVSRMPITRTCSPRRASAARRSRLRRWPQ